jgi:hypothetical protein
VDQMATPGMRVRRDAHVLLDTRTHGVEQRHPLPLVRNTLL